ncbi:MAG: hypothetical protein PVS3B3_17620 [Ktedonobacteraceae bacterium]
MQSKRMKLIKHSVEKNAVCLLYFYVGHFYDPSLLLYPAIIGNSSIHMGRRDDEKLLQAQIATCSGISYT